MRKASVLTVVVAMMMTAVGCGSVEEHQLTRPAEEVDAAALASGVSKSFAVDGAQVSVEGERSASAVSSPTESNAADSCSGWCTANYCECTGSYECCMAGCRACWDVIAQ